MSLYTVTAERSGKWWVLQADQASGAISQVARLDQASEIIEAIAFVTGEAEESIEIDVRVVMPDEVRTHLTEADRLRQESEVANTAAARETRNAAQALKSMGLTVRDVGSVMGVSYQRAHQLVAGTQRAPRAHRESRSTSRERQAS